MPNAQYRTPLSLADQVICQTDEQIRHLARSQIIIMSLVSVSYVYSQAILFPFIFELMFQVLQMAIQFIE